MEMILYKTVDNENIINKTKEVIYTIPIKMKGNVDLSNPIIPLNDKGTMNFKQCNYAYLKEFDRFYFIRSIENKGNRIWALDLECDVLETYKADILKSYGEVEKVIGEGDYNEANVDFQVIKEVDIYKSDVELEDFSTMVISTIGG